MWNNAIELVINDPDYYVIINSTNEYYDPSRTVIFQMEPWIFSPEKNWGVKTWGKWAVPDPEKFLKVFTHRDSLNNVQWEIRNNFVNDLEYSKLDKVLSICSQKNFDTGHILRNKFINFMGIFDIYGRQNYHSFNNYKGPLPNDDKILIKDYKYYFSCENNSEYNYATEKIWEPILCETLCFYWGCPNLEEYINPLAFVRLPLDDFEESKRIIMSSISNNLWEQRIDIIRQEKKKILNNLAFFPRIYSFLSGAT